MNIVQRIRRLCSDKGITLAELERTTGIANGTISKWEKSDPKAKTVKAVADFFKVSTDYLLEGCNVKAVPIEEDLDTMLLARGIRDLSPERRELLEKFIEML